MNSARNSRDLEIQFDTDEQRTLVEQAALSRGLSVTAFIRSCAIKEAIEVLKQDQILLLSDRDWNLITNLLESPPAPNERLKKLLKSSFT